MRIIHETGVETLRRPAQPLKTPKRTARFEDSANPNVSRTMSEDVERQEILDGHFCEVIRGDRHTRLRLVIQDEKLWRAHRVEKLQKSEAIEHALGTSLADLFKCDIKSKRRVKLSLAYIVAESVWHYYDSDWMKARWTSETIHFVRQYQSDSRHRTPSQINAFRPYLAVQFGDGDKDAVEYNADGLIHAYPRVCALGILLLEIGIGAQLQYLRGQNEGNELTVNMNDSWTVAYNLSEKFLKQPPPDFDFDSYWEVVQTCLDPCIFQCALTNTPGAEQDDSRGVEQRRSILYDRVVGPIKGLLDKAKWLAKLDNIELLEIPGQHTNKTASHELSYGRMVEPSSDAKEAEYWLRDIAFLNDELEYIPSAASSPERIRITILDTGYDDDSVLFDSCRDRLKGWKDFIEGAAAGTDVDGHGTHLVALIMQIAPEADVYVARVARNSKELQFAINNVAEVRFSSLCSTGKMLTAWQAIAWAQSKWNANIISMSFGYVQHVEPIDKAIHKALTESNVLFFAAAANEGANEREMFPARHDSVIAVRGTDTKGKFQSFNPSMGEFEKVAFGTLGLQVPVTTLDCDSGYVPQSGTSVATAIAAGIAAMLLRYVSRKTGEDNHRLVHDKLRTREGMLAMFKALSTRTLDKGYLYLAPWALRGISDEIRWVKFVNCLLEE